MPDFCGFLEKSDFLRMKNFTWEAEKEWRIIVTHKYNGKENLLEKEGVEIDEYFVPRYRIKIENPFNEIILGPSFSDYYVESVGEWFDKKKYKIKVSKSPPDSQKGVYTHYLIVAPDTYQPAPGSEPKNIPYRCRMYRKGVSYCHTEFQICL